MANNSNSNLLGALIGLVFISLGVAISAPPAHSYDRSCTGVCSPTNEAPRSPKGKSQDPVVPPGDPERTGNAGSR
jgi:hypothetical protein